MKERVVITAASVPSLPRGVKLRFDEARDIWVLLGPERIFNPDPIALEILKRCDGAATVEAIVDDLAATFQAERDVIERDVTALLQDLADKGIMAG
ncbi:MAG: pyrroloquinoline quinone biosynthesis peptide chaperone PqqD [Kiloniellales bacterium]|nr:pyrroloquinoline quinone biosynthesis peptide chaperone PqqD [Kiloniellales bacterium]